MGSQDSNHDGNPLEDRLTDQFGVPGMIAIPDTVLRDFLGANPAFQGDLAHGESIPEFVGVSSPKPVTESSDDSVVGDGTLSPSAAIAAARAADNSVIFKAALQINANEREAAISAAKKVNELTAFIRSKGFSIDDVSQFISMNNCEHSNTANIHRDEFGLPMLRAPLSKSVVTKDNLAQSSIQELTLVQGNEDVPNSSSPPRKDSDVEPKSWSNVVKSTPSLKDTSLNFFPLPEGSKTVSPPDDVLRKGLEKFKCCLVGTFPKGTLPFKVVSQIANKYFNGLLNVYQKDARTYFFKFDSITSLNAVLSKGTWYFAKRPMLVSMWGANIRDSPLTSMPLWFKLTNVPECYWSKEGLSFLASAIGTPICTDSLTAEWNMVPYAKLCVQYTVGADLPDSIEAIVMDDLGNKGTVSIPVTYPAKPMLCSSCKSLGHSLASCPSTKRIWVQKSSIPQQRVGQNKVLEMVPNDGNTSSAVADHQQDLHGEQPWQLVQNKKVKGKEPVGVAMETDVSNESPAPLGTFKNLKNIDEIEMLQAVRVKPGLSNNAKKRLRKARGLSTPPPIN